jgi:DNA-directed RNA polymerase specialized sigma24 family protein
VAGTSARGVRGVLAQIEREIATVDEDLASYRGLLAQRERLVSARAALLGERVGSASRVAQEDVAAYLREHPGARAGVIAGALGVPLTTISAHLYRGRDSRFRRRADGWHVADNEAPKGAS